MQSIRRVFALVAVTAALATGHARASCDDVTPECLPSVDGTGCCDPDTCSYKAVNAKCRGTAQSANAACKSGRCQADHSCLLDSSNDGAYVRDKPCVGWGTNACNMGTCTQQGACNLSGELTPVCVGDANFCTSDCTPGPSNLSYTCEATTLTGLTCYTGTISACVQGTCQTNAMGEAECQSLGGDPMNCAGTAVDTCEALTCATGSGCGTVVTPGADCDPVGDTDCDERACTSDGNCKKVANRAQGTNCTPTDSNSCTYDQCNHKGQCNYHPTKPSTEPCPSPVTTDPCHYGMCNGSTPTCNDFTKANGTACTEDTSSCTNQQCVAGSCEFSSCAAGSGCAVCGYGGTCAGTTVSDCVCDTVP